MTQRRIDVVIGAAYGDEGKGRVTSALATPESLVVRFNGGAQAGHTVCKYNEVNDKYYRHVFSHFGSGTLHGAGTYLSKYFVCNPMEFMKEYKELKMKTRAIHCANRQLFASPECQITTIWDQIINQVKESRLVHHGSVGVGFGETIERSQHREFSLKLKNIKDLSATTLEKRIRSIRDNWVLRRLQMFDTFKTYNLNEIISSVKGGFPDIEELLTSETVFRKYCSDLQIMVSKMNLVEFSAFDNVKHIIFEGAQGLSLDQNSSRNFPHVTRSNTGLTNVVEMTDEPLNVHYVTRIYTTRHGTGPFPREESVDDMPFNIVDKTNVSNTYQGHLRFSHLNFDTLLENIELDKQANNRENITYNGVITCCDQTHENGIPYIWCGERHNARKLATITNKYEEIVGGRVSCSHNE